MSTSAVELSVQRPFRYGFLTASSFNRVEVDVGLYWAESAIRNHEDFRELEKLLEAISAIDGVPTPFQSSGWIRGAADIRLGSCRAAEMRIIVGFEDDRPVAALPLWVTGFSGCRIAKSPIDPLAPYLDVFLVKNSRGLKALSAAVQATDVDAFLFRGVRDGSHLRPLLSELGGEVISQSHAPFADLTRYADFEQFLASRPKQRRERSRLRRRAERLGTLTFEIAESATRALHLSKQALALKRRWLRTFSRKSVLDDDRWCDLLLRAILAPGGSTRSVVSAVQLDDETAAIEIGFVNGDIYYAVLGAIDPRFRSWSPTKLATEETLRWCFASGIKVYDLLPADEAYKTEWTNDVAAIGDWLLARTVRGKISVKLVKRCIRPMQTLFHESAVRASKLNLFAKYKASLDVL